MSSDSTVIFVYVHPGDGVVGESFHASMVDNAGRLDPKRFMGVFSTSSPSPMLSRNNAIGMVLALDPRPDWILWWDTDMALPYDAVTRLIDSAEEHDAKVATCFGLMQQFGHREGQEWTPMPNAYYRFDKTVDDFYITDQMQSTTEPFWCDATGFGFTLIRPSVYDNYPEEHLPFHKRLDEGLGQDIRFFHHAGEKVLYCPQIRSMHVRTMGLDFPLWMAANGWTDEAQGALGHEPRPGIDFTLSNPAAGKVSHK